MHGPAGFPPARAPLFYLSLEIQTTVSRKLLLPASEPIILEHEKEIGEKEFLMVYGESE